MDDNDTRMGAHPAGKRQVSRAEGSGSHYPSLALRSPPA